MPLSDVDTMSPLEEKLRQKILKIERDVLFDQSEAGRQWDDLSKSLVKESAQRRRFEVDNRRQDAQTDHSNDLNGDEGATFGSDTNSVTSDQELQDADEDNLLREFFQSLPESNTDEKTGITTMTVEQKGGNRLMIRDFGKWTGLSPRRILEETCRARYDIAWKACIRYIADSLGWVL